MTNGPTGSEQKMRMTPVQGMPKRAPKNLRWYMRYLHNKIGFFIVGLVIIYGLSGILQTYRDTDLLKHDVRNEKKIAPNLTEEKLGSALKLRNLKVERTEGTTLYFKEGSYNSATGEAVYTTKEWYSWINSITSLHKAPSKNVVHYFTTLFAVALLFMSISAFWMFKPGTKLFSSGVYLTIAGIVAAILLLFMK